MYKLPTRMYYDRKVRNWEENGRKTSLITSPNAIHRRLDPHRLIANSPAEDDDERRHGHQDSDEHRAHLPRAPRLAAGGLQGLRHGRRRRYQLAGRGATLRRRSISPCSALTLSGNGC